LGSVTSFFGIKGEFLRFSRKRQDGSVPNFFSGCRRKHLFIKTCIEKQCTRPLNQHMPSIALFLKKEKCKNLGALEVPPPEPRVYTYC